MFDPRTELATHPSDSWGDLSFVPINRKMIQKFDRSYESNWNKCAGGVQFRLETKEEDSGICSPPLWSNSSPPPSQIPSQPRQNSSRKEAIAKGQFELMEMVKNMPESCYELSLKDIVEHNNQTRLAGGADQDDISVNSNEEKAILGAKINKNKGNIKVLRSRSMDQNRGTLLKMGFVPFSFMGSKKKKSSFVTNKNNNSTCAYKVSPKPEFIEKSNPKNVEREWWKKRVAVYGESESGGDSSHGGSTGRSGSSGSRDSNCSNSSNSSNSSRRKAGRHTNGCWPIFRSKKSEHVIEVKRNPYR